MHGVTLQKTSQSTPKSFGAKRFIGKWPGQARDQPVEVVHRFPQIPSLRPVGPMRRMIAGSGRSKLDLRGSQQR